MKARQRNSHHEKWEWNMPLLQESILVVRHDGQESIANVLKEGKDQVKFQPSSIMESTKQLADGQPRTIMSKASRCEPDGEDIKLVLQRIPEKQVMMAMGKVERKALSRDLVKELVEIAQEEGPCKCQLRVIKSTDRVTEIMANEDEDIPWENPHDVLSLFDEETLKKISESGGVSIGSQ